MARNIAAVNTSRLAPPLIVIRKVDKAALSVRGAQGNSAWDMIGNGQLEAGVSERETIFYDKGYIVNDQPRTSGLTDEIIGATKSFAVARSDNGEIVREVKTLKEAEKLVAGATLNFVPQIGGVEEPQEA